MENKLGRKSEQDWMEMAERLTGHVYKSAFSAGYDAAKDEIPDVEDMAKLLADRYADEELSEMLLILDSVLAPSRVKSVNEQRAELIQRAREFVERQKVVRKGKKVIISPGCAGIWCSADFVVNADKRTVVCLLKSASVNVRSKGIAKCMPGEVFNEWIGKSIALAKALEIDVPKEFVQAVQPDEKVIGMEVHVKNSLYGRYTLLGIGNFAEPGFATLNSNYGLKGTIIDDTNAQY